MARSVRLRSWQKRALDRFLETREERRDFLAVATPGAGKTTFALTAARHHLASAPHAKVIIVVPTQHLKAQWASAAGNFDLHLEPEWAAANGRLPGDMHGIITTYQQVAANAQALGRLSTDAFVVFDEIHHAGDDRAWGDAIRVAFEHSGFRLSLSGTPFRSDTNAIPFVRYDDQEAVPDFEYGYGQALADGGVVRPVYFPRINGQMEWAAPDGTFNSATFEDELDLVRAGQRLRTALSLEGQWLPEVLSQAHAKLTEIRRTHSNAAGLVVAMDQDHARGIAQLLRRRFGANPTVATSDDPMASMRIAQFTIGDQPWIVAVRMVSEGVDIPRLRVGVFATNTTTDLFFRQAIGRLVRYTRGIAKQTSFMYIPDDPRLRTKAGEIAAARRHSLKKREHSEEEELAAAMASLTDGPVEEDQDRQPSMFMPISAVALGDSIQFEPQYDGGSQPGVDGDVDLDARDDNDESLTIELTPPPPLVGGMLEGGSTVTRAQKKGELRTANTNSVRDLVQLTGMTHAAVNGELNRLSGVKKITEATVHQLQARLGHAEHWLTRLTRGESGKG